MIALSAVFMVVEPVSAMMLAALVVRHKCYFGLHAGLRIWLALLAVGLLIHAAGQVELLFAYRPPRTVAWVPIFAAINGAIWTAYFTDKVRARRDPPPRYLGGKR